MVRTRLNIGCRYSTPVRERPLHPTRAHFTPEPSQTQAPVTPATEPERRAGGSLTTLGGRHAIGTKENARGEGRIRPTPESDPSFGARRRQTTTRVPRRRRPPGRGNAGVARKSRAKAPGQPESGRERARPARAAGRGKHRIATLKMTGATGDRRSGYRAKFQGMRSSTCDRGPCRRSGDGGGGGRFAGATIARHPPRGRRRVRLPLRGELQIAALHEIAGALDAPAHLRAQRAVRVPVGVDLVLAPDLLRDLAGLLLHLVPVKRNQKLPVPVPRPAGGAGPPTILQRSRARPLRRGQSRPKLRLGTKLPPCASKRSPSAILSCIARPARSTLRTSAPSASISPASAAPLSRACC